LKIQKIQKSAPPIAGGFLEQSPGQYPKQDQSPFIRAIKTLFLTIFQTLCFISFISVFAFDRDGTAAKNIEIS
jgi:hypothetical protein